MSESIQTLEGHLRSAHFPSIHLTVEGPLQIFTEITPPPRRSLEPPIPPSLDLIKPLPMRF
jgi:hypothetical protein